LNEVVQAGGINGLRHGSISVYVCISISVECVCLHCKKKRIYNIMFKSSHLNQQIALWAFSRLYQSKVKVIPFIALSSEEMYLLSWKIAWNAAASKLL